MVDVRQQRKAGRQPTSVWEVYWPFFTAFSLASLLIGSAFIYLFASVSGKLGAQALLLVIVSPVLLIGFVLISFVFTRLFSSIRGGAETLGNVTFLTATGVGFKIGGLVGLAVFLWVTPDVFGDPFAGNPSAKSSVIAQLILKAIGFVGLFGMIGSRLENYLRPEKASDAQTSRAEASRKAITGPALPKSIQWLIAKWPYLAALSLAGISIITRFIQMAFDAGGANFSGLSGALIFSVLVWCVMTFYFKTLDKIIRAMSGAYGFYVGVK